MPVSLGEWRVRIGRFVHSVREYVIRERKEKLLKERIRRLRLLQKRLLEKKEKSEEGGESNPNDLSVKVDNAPNESNIINIDTTHDTHKEESSKSVSTIGDEYTFPFFFILLLSFSLLLSLIFFFVIDCSILFASYKSFLKWSYWSESSWRIICLMIIFVCSSLAYFVLPYVITKQADLQDNLVLINNENAKTESSNKVNNTPTESSIKEYNTPTESNIKENNTPTESNIKENNTPSESTIKKKNTPTESTIKENNTPTESAIGKNYTLSDSRTKEKNDTESAKECNSIQINATIKEIKTSFIARDGTLEIKQAKTNTSKRKTIKDKITPTELTIRENSTLPESTIKDNIAPKECHIDTRSAMADNPSTRKKSKRKTTKGKKTVTESTYKSNTTMTESTINDNNTQNRSAIKVSITKAESSIKESSNPSTIKDKSPKRKISRSKTTKEKNISTESHIKESNITIGYTIDRKSASTESAIKINNPTATSVNKGGYISTECTIKNSNARTKSTNNALSESTIKKKNTPTECTIKVHNTTAERTINCNETKTESIIKDRQLKTEFTIKDYNRSGESTMADTKTPYEPTIKDYNPCIELSTKDNTSAIQCAIKEKNTPFESDIKENNTLSGTPTEDNNNQTMKVNIAQAEYTIRSGIQKVLSDGKHSISGQIPSSLKGTTNDSVMQESTCLPEIILIKAGDVELNPGPFERSATIQEQELVNLSYDVPSSKYTELCIALGVSYSQSQTTLDRHLLDFTRSLIAIFCEWKNRQRDGTDCRQDIAAALCGVHLDALGDKMSGGGYLPQEAAPTESEVAEESQRLTKQQVDQCAQDFRTFYRTRLCKIKTDPSDFNSILEFERIYTNLVLLRNEMGTTRKTPLDYTELLTTKVNGEFPKRLMVEGEGGAGKTTFCSKIAWDWAERTKEFEEFDWVLVIPFRNTKEGQTVGDIAKTYLSDSNTVQSRQIDNYIMSAPLKVFIIFDGLDEYEGDIFKESSDIAKIIRLEKFVECRVLVTTRPWRAVPFKSRELMMQTFVFLAIAGFDRENISTYISKYFQDDPPAGYELITYIESNDLIQENIAPFPLFIAMLCILWRNSDADKRNIMRKLKTFSQLFTAMIISLKDNCLTKQHQNPNVKSLTNKEMNYYLSQIGKIAYSGVLKKMLMYTENDFSGYDEALEACCRIGVLSREIRIVPRQDRRRSETDSVTPTVFFPNMVFQEYLAGMYLASLYESDHERYEKAMNSVIQRAEEFRYLLYFTASQTKNVAIDVTNRLINIGHYRHILVDVTFEAYDEDAEKLVGQHVFAEQKSLEINDKMSAHTVSGYIFIMDNITVETLILSRSCGPAESLDLADVICSSTSLTALELSGAALHDDFYGSLESKVKTSKVERLSLKSMKISDEHASRNLARFLNNLPRLMDLTLQDNRFDGRFYSELASGVCSVELGASGHSVRKLHLDHRFLNDMLQHGFTVENLFPNLEQLRFTTLQTVSPNIVGSLAHSGLKELLFGPVTLDEYELIQEDLFEDEEYHVPLVGDPSSLEHVFLKSFPLLTNLSFNDLVIGNSRCKIILSSLKQHQQLNKLCVIHCYTDEELDPIVSVINMENRLKVNIQHDQDQKRLECMDMSTSLSDALCNRTSIQELILTGETIFSNAWFSDENQRRVDSKVQKLSIGGCILRNNDPSASRDLARFICLQPSLIDLTIGVYDTAYGTTRLHDEFYHELARLATTLKVQKLSIEGCNLERNDPSASRDLARFLCLQPCLIDLTIGFYDTAYGTTRLHDEFYHELARLATTTKIQNLSIGGCNLERNNSSAARDLAKFLCLQPCLIDLTIQDNDWGYSPIQLHDEFYHELARLASFSQIQHLLIGGCNLERNDSSAARDLARFLCLQPCLIDLTIQDDKMGYSTIRLHDEFYHELALLASSSQIQKLTLYDSGIAMNDQTASRDLARFLHILPCLIDLKINGFNEYLHDDIDREFSRLASPFQIQKLTLYDLGIAMNDQATSRDLARFLCIQPCLTELTINGYKGYLHEDFYLELSRLASYFKIEKVCIEGCDLRGNDPTASRDLARFLCLLPCLIDLTITDYDDEFQHLYLHDDFYHELARQASSSKIGKLCVDCNLKKNDPTASRALAKFVCLLPCLTNLTLKDFKNLWLHDDFYRELALLASSSKIQNVRLEGWCLEYNDDMASRNLARFLCILPCLTNHTITDSLESPLWFSKDFYQEIALEGPSSKNHFFNKKLHLDERLEELKEKNLKQQTEYIRHLVHPTLSDKTSCPNSRAHEPLSSHQGSVQQYIEYPPFVTPLGFPQHFQTSKQDYISGQKAGPVAETDQNKNESDDLTIHLLNEFHRVFQTYETSQENSQGLDTHPLREDTATNSSTFSALPNTTSVPGRNIRGHCTGFKPMYELDNYPLDVPSTSSVNEHHGNKTEGASAVSHLQPKVEGFPKYPEPDPTVKDDKRGENQTKSHGSEDGILDEPSTKKDKKIFRQTDSSDEDGRTRGDTRTMSHGSKDDSLGGRPRKRKKKTRRQTLHGYVQQQFKYSSVVTPPDLDVPSTSGINAQMGKIPEGINENLQFTPSPTPIEIEKVSDVQLDSLAARIPPDKYHPLSDELSIEYDEALRILKRHGSDSKPAMRECLSVWKNKTGGSFTELNRILNSVHLGDKYHSEGIFDQTGGELQIPSFGLTLSIPPSALPEGSVETITLDALTDIPPEITLRHDETLVTYGFQCLPSGLQFVSGTPVRLKMSHCANLIDPTKVQVVMYSKNHGGEAERIEQTSRTCQVTHSHVEISLEHFTKVAVAIVNDPCAWKDKLMSFMPFLAKIMPTSRKMMLEFRMVNKTHGISWRDVHEIRDNAEYRPAKDDDDEMNVRNEDMDVTCQLEDYYTYTENVNAGFLHKSKHTVYFALDFNGKADDLLVKLKVIQSQLPMDIKFRTPFLATREIIKKSPGKTDSASPRPSASTPIDFPPRGASAAAGEVSTSTARPTEESREQDFDENLKTVAREIHKDADIDSLGKALGFEIPDIKRYIQMNKQDYAYTGTLSMLRDWRNNTTRSEERQQLKKALIAINHRRLAEDIPNDMATQLPSVNQTESTDEDERTTGDKQIKSNASKDESLDGRPRKKKKKTNRETDSTDIVERTTEDKQIMSNGSKDDSLGGLPRKKKKKTNRRNDSTDEGERTTEDKQIMSNSSKDDSPGGLSSKKKKKKNRRTDSTDEGERTTEDKQIMSNDSNDDSLGGIPRKRKKKTNLQTPSP